MAERAGEGGHLEVQSVPRDHVGHGDQGQVGRVLDWPHTARVDKERSWRRSSTVQTWDTAQHHRLVDRHAGLELSHCSQLGLQHLLLLLLNQLLVVLQQLLLLLLMML